MNTSYITLLALLLSAHAGAQNLLWEIPGANFSGYYRCAQFGDYDGDGAADLLARHGTQIGSQWQYHVDILSGRNGAVLHQRVPSLAEENVSGGGDMDGDGYDEYVWLEMQTLRVYSPRRSQVLFTLPPIGQPPTTFNGYYGEVRECRIDLDGDGRGDILTATRGSTDSSLFAYSHLGAMRYSIPAAANGWVIRSIANVGDRDGDGGEDFLVGALGGAMVEGGVFLISGRSGSLIRFHPGLQPFDLMGGTVGSAGDFDRDGVLDYAASNVTSGFSSRQITMVWSGATGALLRTFADPNFQLGTMVSAKHDADFDGLPDVLFSCPGCQPQPSRWGIVHVTSARDGWKLNELRPSIWQGNYPISMVDMGIQPSDPHPTYAFTFEDIGGQYILQAWSSGPARSTLSGGSCATTGNTLVPGLRATAAGSRLQLAGAPPGALAWCILGDGTATTTSGLPLPIALDPYGFQGCSLNVPLDFVGAAITGTTGIDRGYAAVDLPIPLAATGGRRFAAQWLVLDPLSGLEAWTSRRDFWLR